MNIEGGNSNTRTTIKQPAAASVAIAPQGVRKLPKWDDWVGKGAGLDYGGGERMSIVQESESLNGNRVIKNLEHGAGEKDMLKEGGSLIHGEITSSNGGVVTKTPPSNNTLERFVSIDDLVSNDTEKDGVLGCGKEEMLQEGGYPIRGETSSPSSNDLVQQFVSIDDLVTGDEDEDDILVVAIKAGWKFPRPRWWLPDGYGRGKF